ncbi:hypothetical protein ACQ4PT_034000 [Festuca glaucescens]
MAPRSPFAGLVVRLVGFTDEQEAYYKNAVEENGGTITTGYKILGTHVVACSETTCYDDPICVKARSKSFGCAVVNEFWLDDAINAIDEGHLPDHDIVTYKVPQSLNGICCLPILRISVAGYDGRETLHLKRIGALIGATFYDQFEEDKLTHLIFKVPCYPFPETLANLDVKSILLKAFGLVHDEHLEDQSLSGLYSFSDFILSIKSKSVKLQKIARFSLTKVSKQTDMDRHINMVDPSETFSTFITLYDAFVGLSSYEQMCMKNMKEYKDWIDYHLRWVVLEESLDAKKVQVKSKEEEKARAAGRNASAVARDAYTRDFRGLVPFIRDSFVHPAKDYKVYMIAVMMIEFRDFLANLQEELYLLGKLPALKH